MSGDDWCGVTPFRALRLRSVRNQATSNSRAARPIVVTARGSRASRITSAGRSIGRQSARSRHRVESTQWRDRGGREGGFRAAHPGCGGFEISFQLTPIRFPGTRCRTARCRSSIRIITISHYGRMRPKMDLHLDALANLKIASAESPCWRLTSLALKSRLSGALECTRGTT